MARAAERVLTVREVRHELDGVSGELVRKLARNGVFPHAYKVGGDWFVPVRDITPQLRLAYAGGRRPKGGRPRRRPLRQTA